MKLTRTSVCGTLMLLMLGAGLCAHAQGDTDYISGRPWTAVIPDPDKVDWTSPDRPGYRYRGMLPQHERFYELVQAKRARGEELSDADRRFIGYLVAARRWPEGPRPNAFWRAFLHYLREQTTDELNVAQRLMLWEALSRGIVPMDMPHDDYTRKTTAYLRSEPFRARNWFERAFGRVEPWMDYSMAQQGYEMGGGGPGAGVFPPTGDFNGLVIRYNFAGVSLGEPTDQEGFTTSRSYTGTVGPGTVTISGSGSISRGWSARLRVYASIGATQIDEEFSFDAPGGKDFSYTVQVPPDAVGGQISIRLTGLYSTAGAGSSQVTRGLAVSASLEPSAEAVAAQRDRADAEWRAQVEQTLRELGYEETPAGRELRELREALAGGDAAWRDYCARKDAQMRGEKTEAETEFDEIRRLTQASEQEWDAYVATQTGGGGQTAGAGGQATGGGGQTTGGGGSTTGGGGQTASARPPDVGGLTVGTGSSGGSTTGTAEHFNQTAQVCGAMNYADLPAGSLAVAVWTRNGTELTRSQREIGGTGWVSFSLMTQDAGGLPPGTYTLTITVGGEVLGRKTFTVGGAVG